MKDNSVFDCTLIDLGKIGNRNGNITIAENNNNLPFIVKRIFHLYDVPSGSDRGAHAHKECHQLLIAASGSFEVLLDDGKIKRHVLLNRPNICIHITPGIWASELNFSSGAVCLVLASNEYEVTDYIRDYDEFLEYKRNEKK